MKKLGKWLKVMGAIVIAVSVVGCACLPCSKKGASPAPRAVSKGGCPSVVQKDGMNIITTAIPTGDTSTSVLLLERTAPIEVAVGQTFESTITVTNLTNCPLDDVVVTDRLTGGDYRLTGSAPQAKVLPNGMAQWDLGTLEAKGAKTIRLEGTAGAVGDVAHCFQATYVRNLCQTVAVVQPKLQLTKTAPAEVVICDQIPMRLVVTNTGTGVAKNVVVTDTLPAGLVTVDGQQTVTLNAGDLKGGESKEFTVIAKAEKVGAYRNTASAKSDNGLTADAAADVTVRQAVLTIAKSGTEMVFSGRPINYSISVGNTGNTVAKNVVLSDAVPAGTTFVSASNGGVANAAGTVVWNLGDIEPKTKKDVTMTVTGVAIGKVTNVAVAAAECAAQVSASAVTEIKGVPAILLEVIDIDDPIEVGGTEVYVITVTNQGTANDTNIAVTCTLEDAQEYVSGTGPTEVSAAGKTIKLAPLATLAPKAKAEWRVTVKATKAGDIRFGTVLNSDNLARPVAETESTHQY